MIAIIFIEKRENVSLSLKCIECLLSYGSCDLVGMYSMFIAIAHEKKIDSKYKNLTQNGLQKSLGLGNTKYYRILKLMYNAKMIDILKKLRVKYFIDYDDKEIFNTAYVSEIVMFDSSKDIDNNVKDRVKDQIAESEKTQSESVKIVSSRIDTYYIVNSVTEQRVDKVRDFETDLHRYRRKGLNIFREDSGDIISLTEIETNTISSNCSKHFINF